ncbi:MAG TPA: rhomboid family intramembrane serine protease [Spirochaetota bacterium]|nr:rhomboid family intramembrane serine protease [Spirochaetota bacterium]
MNGRSGSAYQGIAIKLIIINVVIFVLQMLTGNMLVEHQFGNRLVDIPAITYYLGLIPSMVVKEGYIWQLFTYMFLHSPQTLFHLFFNMYALMLFGIPVEQVWGGKRFLQYYLFCGIGAGITILTINLISGGMGYYIPTIGASGAVFGLLLAFGILFPNAELLLFFIIPIKAKYLVVLFGGIELFLELFGGRTSISHLGHLGGLFFGIVFFLIFKKRALRFKTKLYRASAANQRKSPPKISSRDEKSREESINQMQQTIMKKLHRGGQKELTDDEIQYIKYLEIMLGDDAEKSCDDTEYDIESGTCRGCDNRDACFLIETRKFVD